MSHYILRRNMLYGRKYLTRILKAHCNNACRTVTVASTTEDPALANARPYDEIPSLPSLPLIGSSWVYFPIIGSYKRNLAHKSDRKKYDLYGPIVRERMGPIDIVSSYEPIEILSKHEGQYPTRGEFMTLQAYRESRKEWYKSNGLLVLQGKEWYDLRTKVQKYLLKPKLIQAFMGPMQDVARDLVNLIHTKKDANKEVPHFEEDLSKWALETVACVGLDTRLNCLQPNLDKDSDGKRMIDTVHDLFNSMNDLEVFAGNFPFWKYFRTPTYVKYEKASDIFTEIAFKHINRSYEIAKNRKNDESDLTLLQSMLMTKDLDVSGVMVTAADMLFAGIESTSISMGFFLYTLAKNPDKQEKVFQEIKNLLPRKEDRITPDIFNKLHYLKACIKESIRLYPVVRATARALDHDIALSGYRIPAGTMVMCMFQVIYRLEKYFKNADAFVPERWLDKQQKVENPFAFVPFGIGPRSCVGRRVAELEMISVATEIIRNFKVEYHYEDLDMYTRIVNVPDKPLRFKFLNR